MGSVCESSWPSAVTLPLAEHAASVETMQEAFHASPRIHSQDTASLVRLQDHRSTTRIRPCPTLHGALAPSEASVAVGSRFISPGRMGRDKA
jgi:hypothetical protein